MRYRKWGEGKQGGDSQVRRTDGSREKHGDVHHWLHQQVPPFAAVHHSITTVLTHPVVDCPGLLTPHPPLSVKRGSTHLVLLWHQSSPLWQVKVRCAPRVSCARALLWFFQSDVWTSQQLLVLLPLGFFLSSNCEIIPFLLTKSAGDAFALRMPSHQWLPCSRCEFLEHRWVN